MFFVKNAFFAYCCNSIGKAAVGFCLPTYSTHMVKDEPKLNAALFGVMLGAVTFFYTLQVPFSKKLIAKLSRRWVTYIGLVLMCFGDTVMALDPGSYLGKGGKMGINIIGMSVFAYGLG